MSRSAMLFLGAIVVLAVVVSGAYFLFFVGKTESVCISQDLNQKPEEIITDVVNEFERFIGQKNIKLLSTCMSKLLADNFAVKIDPFPFYTIINYVISDVSKISDEKYEVNVNERRLLFKSGISGGSYPEEAKRVSFILEKSADRWIVTHYGNIVDLPNTQVGWKTYRNNEYGFEIKYPLEWMVKTKEFGIVELVPSSMSSGLTIYTEEIPEGQTLDKYLEIRDGGMCEGVPCRKVLNKKEIVIADYTAIQRRESWSDCPCTGQATYFRRGNLVYVFSGAPISSNLIIREEETMYNQVLSTFRFTDMVASTSNWKTYRDEKFGFEFKYPNTYTLDATFNPNTESEIRRSVTLGLKREFYPSGENLSFSGVSISFIVNKNIRDCRERNYDSTKEINNQNFLFDRVVGTNDLETEQVIFDDYYLKTNSGCYLLHSSIGWVTREINAGRVYALLSKIEVDRLEEEIFNIVSTFRLIK